MLKSKIGVRYTISHDRFTKSNHMKATILPSVFLFILLIGYSSNDTDEQLSNNFGDDLSGELNLFPLALNPDFTTVSEANVNDNALVGIIKCFFNEIITTR